MKFKKYLPLLLLILAFLWVGRSDFILAGTTEINNLIYGGGVPPEAAGIIDAQYSSALTASTLPKTTNTVDFGSALKAFRNAYVASTLFFTGTGAQPAYPAPLVITPNTTYPTPAGAGTPTNGDTLSAKFSLIASTAPTATFVELPRATLIPGFVGGSGVYNQAAANPVAIVPVSGDSINATAAGTPFACTTGKKCICDKIANTQYLCTGG